MQRRVELEIPGRDLAERVMAEAWAAGVLGIEEAEGEGGVRLIVYLDLASEPALREAIERFAADGVLWSGGETLEPVDWSERWRDGLEPIVVSPRLVVRPSFTPIELAPGQQELVIDPGQAFGTGSHASTRLALEWVDWLSAEASRPPRRVLDVGTGTGVLALAALRLGARSAVGFDLDAEAVREARLWAMRNDLADRLQLIAGPISAIGPESFDWVLVNLLRSEMLPIAAEIAAATRRGGCVVLSGLLGRDRAEVQSRFAEHGWLMQGERECVDAGGDHWISPLLIAGEDG